MQVIIATAYGMLLQSLLLVMTKCTTPTNGLCLPVNTQIMSLKFFFIQVKWLKMPNTV